MVVGFHVHLVTADQLESFLNLGAALRDRSCIGKMGDALVLQLQGVPKLVSVSEQASA
jgi:hypothetical protein